MKCSLALRRRTPLLDLFGFFDLIQGGRQNSNSEMSMIRTSASRDTGKSAVSQPSSFSGMPFKEQQLKQLRAQCLVFLAFRNGLMPKKLHLEVAFGNIFPKEDSSCKELVDLKGKGQFSNEPNCTPEVFMPSPKVDSVRAADRVPLGGSIAGRSLEVDSFKEAEKSKIEDRNCQTSELSMISDEGKHLLASRKPEAEMQSQENVEFQQRTSGVI